MKKIFKYSLLVLFVAGILSSCMDKNARKKNYPAPVISEPPVGTVFTIDSLKRVITNAGDPQDYTNDTIFKGDGSLYGIVTADETSGNCYKYVFLQERATGAAIELYMNAVTGLRIGDSVRVCLKGSVLGVYRGTPQIQNLDPKNVIVLANGMDIEPQHVTISEIKGQRHLCKLVTLDNVQFDDPTLVWAVQEEGSTSSYANRNLNQFDDNCNKTGDIIVRTSTYAAFAGSHLPQGKGSITAIVTLYRTKNNYTWQLLVRTANEAVMNEERCPQ